MRCFDQPRIAKVDHLQMTHLRLARGGRVAHAVCRDADRGPGTDTVALIAVTASHSRLRVVVAEDQPHVRAALVDLVAEEGFELAGVAATGEEAVTLCERVRPEAALVDVKMPSGGAPMVAAIRSVSPTTAVVVLSAYDDVGARRAMGAAGASAYLVKGGSVAELVAAVRRAAGAG